MKIESDHFETMEELLKHIKIWVEEEDIYYTRWFGLNEMNILANEIIRLNNIINKAIEYIEKELDIEKICRQEKSLTICKKGLLEILDKVGSDKE